MSKFDQYLKEQNEYKTLCEKVDIICEKLGSLDAMDASELGLAANVPITGKMIATAFASLCKKGKCDVEEYLTKLKKVFRGITDNEIENIRLMLKAPVSRGGDEWGNNPNR